MSPFYSERAATADRLLRQLEVARANYASANASFRALAGEVPGGVPLPDGSLRLRQAGQASRDALNAYVRALREFNDFAMHRFAPDQSDQ